MNFNSSRIALVGVVVWVCILLACSKPAPDELILFDFENDAELDRLHWKCFTLFSLSEKHATCGGKSLKLELYFSSWPGWTPKLNVKDWRGYDAVGFDVYNPEGEEIRITVRIDDREDTPDYNDRYNQGFVLKPGMNRIKIPFKTLLTSGTKRHLDLKRIYRLLIFMSHPKKKHVLYLDYIRLVHS